MKLAPVKPPKKRSAQVGAGCLKTALAVVFIWVGLNSYLVGQAYHLERGAWAPRLVGVFFLLLGLILCWRGVSQFVRGFRRPRSSLEEDLW
ncbi:MAG: phage holin family protein [Thermodesulfobacteriota bacterium]